MDDIIGTSPYSYMRKAQALYAELDARWGKATFDMRSAWCGWLSFGFSGTVGISDATGSHEAGIVVYENQMPVSLSCSTAYYSSVLRDLCSNLAETATVTTEGGLVTAVVVFCDAEEHGEYVVTVTSEDVTIRDPWNEDGHLCSVTRNDGGSYLRDLANCLCDLYGKIRALPDEQQDDVFESLCMFCESLTEEDGEISVEDARSGDVAPLFERLCEVLNRDRLPLACNVTGLKEEI